MTNKSLVFYAQSAGMVISRWEREGRMEGEPEKGRAP